MSVNPLDDRICPYCLSLVKDVLHTSHECPNRGDLREFRFPNGWFGIVVPEPSNTVWINKVGGFTCANVHIQGSLYPIGDVQSDVMGSKYGEGFEDALKEEFGEDFKDKFKLFDDPEKARTLFVRGLKQSNDESTRKFGPISLGSKLVNERLAGVYTDDEEERKRKRETMEERLQEVWTEIDEELPFEYEEVDAPQGFPRTQEGIKWINITDHNAPDDVSTPSLFQEQWVQDLIGRDSPVAFYYPNSD